jgi:AcrR family transcriptional regulator
MRSQQETALDAFLGLIAEKGFAAVTLRDVADTAGLSLAELYRHYRDKVALVAAFTARIDAEVLAGVPLRGNSSGGNSSGGNSGEGDPEETARDRLFDVLMRRYDALRPYRSALAAIRRAGTRDPLLALAIGPALRRSMAAMLEAASISSDGLSGALRQNGLLAIDYAVSRVFGRDDTADLSKTMAALDSRLKMAEKWSQLLEKYVIPAEVKAPGPGSQAPVM